MAQRTGSKAHERFSGPQILKVVKQQPEIWENTGRIGIVSSCLATMLCLDGEVKGIDEVSLLANASSRRRDHDSPSRSFPVRRLRHEPLRYNQTHFRPCSERRCISVLLPG